MALEVVPPIITQAPPANRVAQLAAVAALHTAIHERPELYRGRSHLTSILADEVVKAGGSWHDVEAVLDESPVELADLRLGEVVAAWFLFSGTAA